MDDRVSQLARHATLRQLQVFDAIVRHNSFTKAAEALYLTQPTVSIQVKKLSEVLQVSLFEQIGRQVYLTPAGKELQQAVNKILDILVNTEERIDRLKGFAGGNIKLSVISTAQYFVPKVIHNFSAQYPSVSVSMQVGNREYLLERLQKNQDDFYILGQPPEGMIVESVRLAVNPLSFVANCRHALVGKKGLKLEDLTKESFLMREQGSGIRSHIEKVFEEYGFIPNIKMVLGGHESIRLGLLQNSGISVTSLPTLREEINDGRLGVLDVEGFPIKRYWYLVYPKGKVLSIAAERLFELLKEEASTLSVPKLK